MDKFGLAVVTDSRTAHETVSGFIRGLVDRRCGDASDGGVAGSLGSQSLGVTDCSAACVHRDTGPNLVL